MNEKENKEEREVKSDVKREENPPVWWSCESSPSTGGCSAPGCSEHRFLYHRSPGWTVCRGTKQDIWGLQQLWYSTATLLLTFKITNSCAFIALCNTCIKRPWKPIDGALYELKFFSQSWNSFGYFTRDFLDLWFSLCSVHSFEMARNFCVFSNENVML